MGTELLWRSLHSRPWWWTRLRSRDLHRIGIFSCSPELALDQAWGVCKGYRFITIFFFTKYYIIGLSLVGAYYKHMKNHPITWAILSSPFLRSSGIQWKAQMLPIGLTKHQLSLKRPALPLALTPSLTSPALSRARCTVANATMASVEIVLPSSSRSTSGNLLELENGEARGVYVKSNTTE